MTADGLFLDLRTTRVDGFGLHGWVIRMRMQALDVMGLEWAQAAVEEVASRIASTHEPPVLIEPQEVEGERFEWARWWVKEVCG